MKCPVGWVGIRWFQKANGWQLTMLRLGMFVWYHFFPPGSCPTCELESQDHGSSLTRNTSKGSMPNRLHASFQMIDSATISCHLHHINIYTHIYIYIQVIIIILIQYTWLFFSNVLT